MATNDYIEFTLTQNMTSASLAALTFGDSNSSTSTFSGVFQFDKSTLDTALANAGRSTFLAGTIITVKGSGVGAQNLTYNPLSTNVTNNDAWSIELVAGQGAVRDAAYTGAAGALQINNAGDAVWISTSNPPANNTDTSGLIAGMAHSSGALGAVGLAIQSDFGTTWVYTGSVTTGNALANTGTDSAPVLNMVSGGTISAPNGGLNTIWIDGLRATAPTPEPSRTLLVFSGLAFCLMRRPNARRLINNDVE
jgi:hypothetical protein